MHMNWGGGGGGGGQGELREHWELVPGCHVNRPSLKEVRPQDVEVSKTRVYVDIYH